MGVLASIGGGASSVGHEQRHSQNLLDEIEFRLDEAHRSSKQHHVWSIVLACGTTLGSFGSALGAVYSEEWRWLLALLAALPLTALALERCLLPQQRHRWNSLMEARLLALAGQLKYEGASPAEISKQFSRILNEMEDQYPTLFPSAGAHAAPAFTDSPRATPAFTESVPSAPEAAV